MNVTVITRNQCDQDYAEKTKSKQTSLQSEDHSCRGFQITWNIMLGKIKYILLIKLREI